MTQFTTLKTKIQKIWENNEENTSQINNNLKIIDVDFTSVNFNKKIITIPIKIISNNDQETLTTLEQNVKDGILGSQVKLDNFNDKLKEEGSIFTEPINQNIIISLNNFPEWILNHINILPIVELISDINDDIIIENINTVFDEGKLKIGNIEFKNFSKNWIVKLSDNNYLLKIYLKIDLKIVTNVSFPQDFITDILPYKLNLSLKIINPRIYEKTNIHKN